MNPPISRLVQHDDYDYDDDDEGDDVILVTGENIGDQALDDDDDDEEFDESDLEVWVDWYKREKKQLTHPKKQNKTTYI